MMRAPVVCLLVCLLASAPATAQERHDHDHGTPEQLGTVHFETSCTPAQQPAFNRAVALLHSFAFTAAREAFTRIAESDPACAIARWGIALTHYGNPFGGYRTPEALAEGWSQIQKGLAAGPKTPREREYLEAAAELFRDAATTDGRARALAYERAMGRLAERWPADPEATIFHALALAHTAPPSDKTYANLKRAGALLEPLFAQHPNHPGLAHYIIHAYDVPPLAPKALDAARRYAQIAPSAPHALHMPSHTFTRLGLWDESIETNIASKEAARRDRSVAEQLHAMDYLVYAYLQTGRDGAARRVGAEVGAVLGEMKGPTTYNAAPVTAGFFAAFAIPARIALERGAWDDAARLEVGPSQFAHVQALTHFARAVGAARAGRPGDARADLERLGALQAQLASANDAYWAEQVAIQHLVAKGAVAHAEGRSADAERLLREAADREDATEKSAVTPGPLLPAREALGEALLALGRASEALEAFERVMQKEPNRLRTLFGAAQAAERTGQPAKAREYYNRITLVAARSDTPDRAELQAARSYLGRQH